MINDTIRLEADIRVLKKELGHEMYRYDTITLENIQLKEELNVMTRSALQMANKWGTLKEKLEKIKDGLINGMYDQQSHRYIREILNENES